MSRLNPWVAWPVAISLVVGGLIGWTVTAISCRPDTCYATATAVSLLAAIMSAGGVGVVVVLAVRSFAEWREATAAGLPPPEPGCEAEPDGVTSEPGGPRERPHHPED